MSSFIPLSVPNIKGNAWKYVKHCLDTGWVSSVGLYVNQFEEAMAKRLKVHAIACVNGTGALHMAYLAMGIGVGDELIMPALTFISPANAARYVGAHPVFIDVDPVYWQLDVEKLEEFFKTQCKSVSGKLINKKTNRPIKGIVVVHLLGQAAPIKAIVALAKKYKLVVIEDVAEGIGTYGDGKALGTWGDVGCFSFNGNKIITCGGGGVITTGKPEIAKYLKYLTTQAKDDEIEYVHHEVGYNYRLTNVAAAIGLSQLEHLDDFIKAKNRISKKYDEAFKKIKGITLPKARTTSKGFWWLYTICIDSKEFGMDSRALMRVLQSQGIQTRPLWRPLHQLKPFAKCTEWNVNVANHLYQVALSLPCSTNMTVQDQQRVIEAIKHAKNSA